MQCLPIDYDGDATTAKILAICHYSCLEFYLVSPELLDAIDSAGVGLIIDAQSSMCLALDAGNISSLKGREVAK